MLTLKNVTLICVDCYNYGGAVSAIQKSIEKVQFAAVKFLTDIEVEVDGVDVVQIPRINSKEEYSKFILKDLWCYFKTSHVLVIQHDGYVIDAEAWDDEFLKYDYIGAPWLEVDGYNVGNGGFSLRSYTLQYFLATDMSIEVCHPEDAQICRFYRLYLETKGVKFSPVELAEKFSFELRQPNQPTFGFHGRFHMPYKPYVLIRRYAAMGDVVRVEPVIDWFHKNGYNVILDTHHSFFKLFQQHYFYILHPQQVDGRIKPKLVNLDMSYESKPKQNHLQSYYEYAGIKDGVLRKPNLNLRFEAKSPQYKLFPKYCVIHIDRREQEHRNVRGVNWSIVSDWLTHLGYTIVQIGKNEHDNVPNSVQFNCATEELLLMVCAGADLFIGADSGPSHICVAFGVPAVIFFGSVDPKIIHADLTDIAPIHNHAEKVCDKPFCWHEKVGTTGQECYIEPSNPPCTQFRTSRVLEAINKLTT